MQSDDSRDGEKQGEFYVLQVKRRDIRILCAIAFLWFLWSQGGEIYLLFSKLFESLVQ